MVLHDYHILYFVGGTYQHEQQGSDLFVTLFAHFVSYLKIIKTVCLFVLFCFVFFK